jgi:hypothetical protein
MKARAQRPLTRPRRPAAKVDSGKSSHVNHQGRAKVAHLSETYAQAAAEREGERVGRTPQVYRCVSCGLWHLGKLRGEAS